jgi:hypothetical protein
MCWVASASSGSEYSYFTRPLILDFIPTIDSCARALEPLDAALLWGNFNLSGLAR